MSAGTSSGGARGGRLQGGRRREAHGRGLAVLVAYYAPPVVGIAAQRLEGFVRHLPDLGWDPVVVAPREPHYHRSAAAALPEGVPVLRVSNPEPSRWLRRLAGGGGGEEPGPEGIREVRAVPAGPVARALRAAARELVYVPDAQWPWIPAAARAAEGAARGARGRPVVLFSTSVPFSAHFAARRAADATGAPWVAEYRDPWSVAPPQFGSRTRLRALLDARMDHDVVRRADHLVVTSDHTRSLFLEGFPDLHAHGVTVVRNGWGGDGTPQVRGAPPPDGPLRLAYAGTLLQPAWGAALVRALELLEAEAPGAATLDVYGPEAPWRESTAASPAASLVRLHGLVPGDQVPHHLAGASATVILQPDAVRYVPGKIYEYVGARRPILAAVPRASETADLARAHGDLRLVDPLVPEGVLAALRTLLAEHRAGRLADPRVPAERVAPLSRRAQAAALARVFDAVGRPL